MVSGERIAGWMRELVSESGCRGIAVGLSGGIDSAVTAVLAQQAVGDHMVGVIMPCESNPLDGEHSLLLARRFDMATEYADLTDVYRLLENILPQGTDLAYANIKPRLRMLTLYYTANRLDRKSVV